MHFYSETIKRITFGEMAKNYISIVQIRQCSKYRIKNIKSYSNGMELKRDGFTFTYRL